jgi:hypothetical protein
MSKKKIDKRSKEYRDSIKNKENTSDVQSKDDQIAELMDTVTNLTDTVNKLSKLTLQNTKSIKGGAVAVKAPIKDSGAVIPRADELVVIKRWLDSHSAVCSYSKDLVWAIAANKAYNNVAGLLGIIEREPTLRVMAIKEGIVSSDYLTVILPKENDED